MPCHVRSRTEIHPPASKAALDNRKTDMSASESDRRQIFHWEHNSLGLIKKINLFENTSTWIFQFKLTVHVISTVKLFLALLKAIIYYATDTQLGLGLSLLHPWWSNWQGREAGVQLGIATHRQTAQTLLQHCKQMPMTQSCLPTLAPEQVKIYTLTP